GAASLQRTARLVVVLREAIDAHAQERAELRLARVEALEEVFFERAREERLRQVLRVLVGLLPVRAQVLVERAPVDGRDDIPGPRALVRVGARRLLDQAEARLGERPLRAAHGGITFHARHHAPLEHRPQRLPRRQRLPPHAATCYLSPRPTWSRASGAFRRREP